MTNNNTLTVESTRKIMSIQLDIELTDRKMRLAKVAEAKELIAEMAVIAAREILGQDAVRGIAVDWVYSYRWAEEEERYEVKDDQLVRI